MTISSFDQQFGRKLKALRKRARLTQDQLAERVSRTTDTISNIERGTSPPRLSTAKALADALGVEIAELFQFSPAQPGRRDYREAMEKMAGLLDGCGKPTLDAVVQITATVVGLSAATKEEVGE